MYNLLYKVMSYTTVLQYAVHCASRQSVLAMLTPGGPLRYIGVQVVSEKIIQFSIFICRKSKQSTATTLQWPKHNCPVCKKIFKWYHSMVRCKSYGPLSDEC